MTKGQKKNLYMFIFSCILLIACHFLLIGWNQWRFHNQISLLQTEALQQMMKKDSTKPTLGIYSGEEITPLHPTDLEVDAIELIQHFGVGLIQFPSLGVSLPILEGITQDNLSVGIGTVKPNQVIGEGNFALLGHYTNKPELLFGGLKYLEMGDEILVSYYQEEATYLVTESRIVHQSEGHYMYDEPDGSHNLTLLTCDSNRLDTEYRLLIRAKLKQ